MKKCPECKIKIATNRKTCPLCLNVLQDDDDDSYISLPYPKYKEPSYKSHLIKKIFLYLSIIVIGICGLINILTYHNTPSYWSLIVLFGIIYLWVLINFTIISKRNMAFRLFLQAFFLSILMLIIESTAKQTSGINGYWFIPYVMPFIMMATLITIVFIVFIKTMRYRDYMLYMFMIAIIGFIPIIIALIEPTAKYFISTTGVHVIWPSIACAGLGVATILGMIIFGDKATKDEFKKRFHV